MSELVDAASDGSGCVEHNREEAVRYLTALDPSAAVTNLANHVAWTFQTFDDNADRKSLKLAHILHGSLDQRWNELCRLNVQGAGIFVTVNETDGKGRSAANIVRVRAVFVDLDKGEPLPEKFHAEPHIIVESSRSKWHVYWRVEGCTIDQFRTLQERLIRAYGSDAAVKDPSRVLRLPGFIHQKVKKGVRSPPFRSHLDGAHDRPIYTVKDAVAGLPEEEEPKAAAAGLPEEEEPKAGDQAGHEWGSDQEPAEWTQSAENRLRSALAAIPTDEAALREKLGSSHLAWINVGRALWRLGWGERSYAIWRDWSAQNIEEFNEQGLLTNWRSFERTRRDDKPVTVRTIFHYARQFGWKDEEPTTVEPTYPATHSLPIEEARRELDQHIDYFIRLAHRTDLNWAEEFATEGEPLVQAIRASTGIGKTQRFAALLARRKPALPCLYLVPTHRLGDDIAKHFEERGLTARVYRGRDAADPAIPGNLEQPKAKQVRMCLEPEKVKLAQSCGLRVDKACCKSKEQQCASYDLCGYQRQLRGDAPNVWLAAHNLLFHPVPAFKSVAGVVIDETFYQHGIVGMTPHGDDGESAFTLDELETELPAEAVPDPCFYIRAALREILLVLREHPPGGLERDRLVNCVPNRAGRVDMLKDYCSRAINEEWQITNGVALRPTMTAAQIDAIKEQLPLARMARFRRGVWRALRDLVEMPEGTVSGRLLLRENKQGRRVLRIRGVREIVEDRGKVPTLILDATLPDPAILQTWYPQLEVVADIEVQMPASVHVRQVLKAPVSQRKMWGTGARKAVGRNRQAVRRYILQRWLEAGRQPMLVICQKNVEEWLLKEAGLPEGIAVEHFNAISGLDQYKNVHSLILIGRTVPVPEHVEAIAGALIGVQPIKVPPAEDGKPATWYGRVTRGIRLADGAGVAVEADQHPDPMAEAVRYQICEAELMQALGRARAINRSAEAPLAVDIVADVVLPITADEVVAWEEPSAIVEAAVEGIVLTAPKDMSRAWPAVWATAKAAEWTLEKIKAAVRGEKVLDSLGIYYT